MDFSNVSFDFNTMTGGQNVFSAKEEYKKDERFYVLEKDKDGKGHVVLRFLPDGDLKEGSKMGTIKKVYKINAQDRYTKKFVSEWSPATIGEKDPFQERFSQLWSSGDKDKAKKYGRQIRFIANVKVVSDPAHPENNGKIFLLDMSQTLAEKIQNWQAPSDADLALGIQPKNLFDPMNGYNFILRSTKGTNDIISYDSSVLQEQATAIYQTKEDAVRDIVQNCYKLSEWDKPETYKTYDQLVDRLNWFEATENSSAQKPQILTDNTSNVSVSPVTPSQVSSTPAQDNPPFQADDLDSLIAQMSK